jgi:hypothetical protein
VSKRAAGVVFVGLLLAGCGGGSSDKAHRRDAVDRYFAQLVRAETPVAGDIATLNEAYRHLLTKQMRKRDLRSVALAEQQLSSVRENIGRIAPPPDARAIHENVVRLVDLDLAVARDLRWMTSYLPRLRGTLAPLTYASASLSKAQADEPAPLVDQVFIAVAEVVQDDDLVPLVSQQASHV